MSEKTPHHTPHINEPDAVLTKKRSYLSAMRETTAPFAKRFCYGLFRLFGELTAIVLGVAFLWFYALNALLAKQTLNVSFLEPNASLWFAKAFEGRLASIGDMHLIWRPETGSIVLRAENITVSDSSNAPPLQDILDLQAAFAFDNALTGNFRPQSIHVNGGAVTWRRAPDGLVVAGLGTPQTVGRFGTFVLENRDVTASRKSFSMSGLTSLEIRNADVFVQDAQRGFDFKLTDTDLTLLDEGEQFNLAATARVTAGQDESPVDIAVTFSPDFEDFDLRFHTSDFNGSKFAPKADMLAFFKRIDAPADIRLAVTAAREVGLKKVGLDINIGSGQVELGSGFNALDGFALTTEYDPEVQTLRADKIELKSSAFTMSGQAELSQIGRPATGFFANPVIFKTSLSNTRIDAVNQLDNPLDIKRIEVSGAVDLRTRALDMSVIDIGFPNFSIESSTRLTGKLGGGLEALSGRGSVIGDMTPRDLLSLWPVEFATGARRWIDRSVLAGQIQNLDFKFNVPEAAFSGAPLRNEDVNLTFAVANADVRYISTMSPYTNVSGEGVLRGNSFEITTNSGVVGGLNVSRGHVNIPRLNPHGGDFTIEVSGQGSVQNMLTLIDQEPFGFASRYGINPDNFSGDGDIDLTITRPLLERFDQNRILYEVEGRFSQVGVPFELGGHKLEKGDLVLKANKSGMKLNGPVNLGPWRADMEWEQKFSPQQTPTIYRLAGPMDRDTLDGFGVGLREYFDGEVEIVVDALGRGLSITESKVHADLTQADIRLGEYWSKAPGVAASLTASVSRTVDTAISVEEMTVNAPGLSLDGHAEFAPNMQLVEFELYDAKIDGFVDGRAKVMPNTDRTAFDIDASGTFLDISPFVSQAVTARAATLNLPMNLSVDVEKLALSDMFILNNASLNVEHNGIGTKAAEIMGDMSDGAFRANLKPKPGQDGRTLFIDVPNASIAVSAFLRSNNIRGGRLNIAANLPNVGEEGPLTGEIEIEDVVLVRAPILAQMLSLASLKGLTDTMGGAGLEFRQVSVPFSYEDGDLSVRDGRASGPALGLTGSGDISFPNKYVDFDGVLVPAYTANSVLESIPLIGDIFVGKKGEGIFALSYSVKGPFSATQVGVNPLSALTPGFLRRIFDTQRDDLPVDDAVKEEPTTAPPNPDGPR